jgi:hypothetical protein
MCVVVSFVDDCVSPFEDYTIGKLNLFIRQPIRPCNPLPSAADDERTAMYMLLYSRQGGPFLAVNKAFEDTFVPAGRMCELLCGGYGRVCC